jgi:hypothetical protein
MRRTRRIDVQGVKRALRPGGRFVADFGGQGNALSVRVALSAVLGQEGIDAEAGNPWCSSPSEHLNERNLGLCFYP